MSGSAPDESAGAQNQADHPAQGAREAAARLARLAGIRIELAAIELAEEREHLLHRLALLLGGVLLLAFAVFALAATLILLLWETHRVLATLGAALLCGTGGGLLLWQATHLGRRAGIPFAATRAEFAKDHRMLFDPPPTDADEAQR